jgi:hypothetical protein
VYCPEALFWRAFLGAILSNPAKATIRDPRFGWLRGDGQIEGRWGAVRELPVIRSQVANYRDDLSVLPQAQHRKTTQLGSIQFSVAHRVLATRGPHQSASIPMGRLFGLVSCPISNMAFAVGQLAVFQGGASRTGTSDEHI